MNTEINYFVLKAKVIKIKDCYSDKLSGKPEAISQLSVLFTAAELAEKENDHVATTKIYQDIVDFYEQNITTKEITNDFNNSETVVKKAETRIKSSKTKVIIFALIAILFVCAGILGYQNRWTLKNFFETTFLGKIDEFSMGHNIYRLASEGKVGAAKNEFVKCLKKIENSKKSEKDKAFANRICQKYLIHGLMVSKQYEEVEFYCIVFLDEKYAGDEIDNFFWEKCFQEFHAALGYCYKRKGNLAKAYKHYRASFSPSIFECEYKPVYGSDGMRKYTSDIEREEKESDKVLYFRFVDDTGRAIGAPSDNARLFDIAYWLSYGECGETNYEMAAKIWQLLDCEGIMAATYNLALCYVDGKGVQQDFKQAFKLFSEAASRGYADAMHSLAICYENGIGCEKDQNLAEHWGKRYKETNGDEEHKN